MSSVTYFTNEKSNQVHLTQSLDVEVMRYKSIKPKSSNPAKKSLSVEETKEEMNDEFSCELSSQTSWSKIISNIWPNFKKKESHENNNSSNLKQTSVISSTPKKSNKSNISNISNISKSNTKQGN